MIGFLSLSADAMMSVGYLLYKFLRSTVKWSISDACSNVGAIAFPIGLLAAAAGKGAAVRLLLLFRSFAGMLLWYLTTGPPSYPEEVAAAVEELHPAQPQQHGAAHTGGLPQEAARRIWPREVSLMAGGPPSVRRSSLAGSCHGAPWRAPGRTGSPISFYPNTEARMNGCQGPGYEQLPGKWKTLPLAEHTEEPDDPGGLLGVEAILKVVSLGALEAVEVPPARHSGRTPSTI